ncbi:mRNA splicing protein [Phlyctochytrium planicorne]|nr:mRNA splicing protein [Phlyctochytrium planicorne]
MADQQGMQGNPNFMALGDAGGKLSREDFKRQKAIEEQRKAGTLPAEVDPETGRDINPHIPNYISQAPWYLDIHHPTLKHQRGPNEKAPTSSMDQWYQRGKFAGPAAKKYRKGACENWWVDFPFGFRLTADRLGTLGAMTHKTRDCLDRPRSKGAKFTNKNIAPDEILVDMNLGFEAKRDRWNGYDPNDYQKVVEEGEAIELERKRIREKQAKEKLEATAKDGKEKEKEKAEESGSEDDEGDEEKYADAADAVGQKLDAKTRTTVRNLRIREDTAKYLLNLDANSAYYDPKTRSMRDNPLKDRDPNELTYAGDNFKRWTGDAPNLAKLQVFAWSASDRGKDVHLNANPTQGELLFKEYQKKKEAVTETQKGSILQKYGGDEYLKAPPKELLLAQTEAYVEYSQTGKVIKGQEKMKTKSKYEEDVYLLNHTSIWGSFWKDGRWGFACCHSFSKQSYCTGQAGIDAEKTSKVINQGSSTSSSQAESSDRQQSMLAAHMKQKAKELADGKGVFNPTKKGLLGSGDVVLDQDKLKKAMEAEAKKKRGRDVEEEEKGGRKKYHGINGTDKDVTEEELEAYRLMKSNFEDPMAKYRDEEDEED